MLQLRQLINSVVQRLREQEADEPQPLQHEQDAAAPRQGIPQLLSDEDARTAQRKAGDLWGVMHDEDLRRERLFRLENVSTRVRQTPAKRRATPGAHIGFQMARLSTQKVYCCASCSTPAPTKPEREAQATVHDPLPGPAVRERA